ncbi:MAG: TonB-dependent receptor [Rudaea sp.]|uniref:TonB-dependent receptor n=1 Tax=Rudaea sp. TaxID=2136325 RepID=UPI0039E6CBF2
METIQMKKHHAIRTLKRTSFALALGAALACGTAHAQSTTGTVYGTVPSGAGHTVVLSNNGGFRREVAVDANGRFNIDAPIGNYDITYRDNGKDVETRKDVLLLASSGTQVVFVAQAETQTLEGLTVTASATPAIDVSSVDSRSVFTSVELAKLPVARSAEAVALLAPGTTQGSSYFTGPTGTRLVSFGGSSVTENAYYINGFNTTDPLSGFGGITLPYGAIAQEEVILGGYGPEYGRSDGGVLSMNGKRGSNDWHFGGQVNWAPKDGRAEYADWYYPHNTSSRDGKIYQARSLSDSWNLVQDAYVSGPIVPDKLFFFVGAEHNRTSGNSVGSIASPYDTTYTYHDPSLYAKLDWHITDNHILEYTRVTSKDKYEAADYNFDYATRTTGDFNDYPEWHDTAATVDILKYTGYITDNLTVSSLWGKQKIKYGTSLPAYAGYDPSAVAISGASSQNPAITGGQAWSGSNPVLNVDDPLHRSYNSNWRIDLSYKLGDHTLSAGVDNQKSYDIHDGQSMSGPGYAWEYATNDPATAIIENPFVDAPGNYPGGETGYYVDKYIFVTAASIKVRQRAQYLQDSWQVSDRWLVKLGVRNDQFTNYNPAGAAYLNLSSPQWAPRLGLSWDVNGDSSLKVYGNAGRYYLAMPASVALRGAAGSIYTRQYYTYTGIDSATGVPTGLTPINTVKGLEAPISANNEYGQPPDPNTVAAANIKSENQDEYVLGFEQQLSSDWAFGVKGIYRRLNTGLDDICDQDTIYAKAVAAGYTGDEGDLNGCYLSNPGKTNVYRVSDGKGGYIMVPVTAADFGMPKMKRNYYAAMFNLTHPFDGTWAASIDYVYSRSYGNSEGQVRSDLGQADVAATVDWDFGQFESFANGYLANDRKHQLKVFGMYQLTPEWMVSGTVEIASGKPKSCLGYYGPDQEIPYYGSYYHWCDGVPSRPGDAGRNPWTHVLNLNAEYRPEFADHKLAFNVAVFNVLNEQNITQTSAIYQQAGHVATSYGRPVSMTAPRYVRLGVNYDF